MATKTGQYSSVDELPDLLQDKKTDYKSVDDLPDLKKKSNGGVSADIGGTVGSGKAQSGASTEKSSTSGSASGSLGKKKEIAPYEFKNKPVQDNVMSGSMQQQQEVKKDIVADNQKYISEEKPKEIEVKVAELKSKPTSTEPAFDGIDFLKQDIINNAGGKSLEKMPSNLESLNTYFGNDVNFAKTYFKGRLSEIDSEIKSLNNAALSEIPQATGDIATGTSKPQINPVTGKPFDNRTESQKEINDKMMELKEYKNKLIQAQNTLANKYVAWMGKDLSITEKGKLKNRITGDEYAEEQQRLEDKGIPLTQEQRYNTDKQGMEVAVQELNDEYEGKDKDEMYYQRLAELNLMEKGLLSKYPEYKKQQGGKLIAQLAVKDEKLRMAAQVGSGELDKEVKDYLQKTYGIKPKDLDGLSYGDIPSESFGGNIAKALTDAATGVVTGVTRIAGTALGIDEDRLTNINEKISTLGSEAFGDNPYAKTTQPETLVTTDLQNIRNPDAGKYNWTGETIKNAIGTGIGGLVGFIGGMKGTGKLLSLSDDAAMTSYITGSGFEHNYQKANEVMGKDASEVSKGLYATGMGYLEALAFKVLPKDKIFFGSAETQAAQKELAKTLTGVTLQNINKEALESGFKKVLKAATGTAEETAKIGGAMSIAEMAKTATAVLLGDDKDAAKFYDEGLKNIEHIVTDLPFSMGIPLGLMEIPKYKQHSNRTKQILFDAGSNSDTHIATIKQAQEKGLITPEQAEKKLEVVQTMQNIVKSLPETNPVTGERLTQNQQTEYAYNRVKEIAVKTKADEIKDAALAPFYKKEAQELVDERTAIVTGTHDAYKETAALADRIKESGKQKLITDVGTKTDVVQAMQEQALTTPASVNRSFNRDVELTTDLIARNEPQVIKAEIKSLKADHKKLIEQEKKAEANEVQKNIDLLEAGLEKQSPKKVEETIVEEKVEPTKSKFPLPKKPVDEMSATELDSHIEEVKKYQKETKLTKEEEDALTPEQADEYFGKNLPKEGVYDPTELQRIRNRVSLIEEAETIGDISATVKRPLIDFARKQDTENLSVIKAAKRQADKLGVSPEEFATEINNQLKSEFGKDADAMSKVIFKAIEIPTEQSGKDVLIEKKNTGTEIEPELGDGRKPVTLSGSTESERQIAIENRQKETKQTPMTTDRDNLLERIQKYNKLSRSEKRQAYMEANKLKLAVDNFNNTHDQKHSISTNRDGSLELRNNPTEARKSGKPIKNTLKGNENAIVDNGKPLMERDDNTKKVFQDLLDADVLPVSRRVNGERMSEAEHDATIQDIMDGIPSQRAENYLNSLEKQIKEDNFDFGNPDKNVRTTLNDALQISVEAGEPMTIDKVEQWLKNESELTKEDEILFDNLDNLITHYEQLHESESGTPTKVQQPTGKGQESNSGKANENGQPKSESSTANKKEPVKNEEAKAIEVPDGAKKEIPTAPKLSEDVSEAGGGKKEPPIEPTEPVSNGKDRMNDKGVLNHLVTADKVPEASKEGFKEKGLKYETKSQKEAEDVAKSIIDEYGIEDAVLLAEAQKFDGDVNSLIYAESLNRLGKLEAEAKTPEERLAIAKQFAEVGIKYDEAGRKGGRFSSAINYFYKKSPLGIQMMENAKRKEQFEDFAKPKDKSWKEFFDEMVKEPEFDALVKEQVKEGMKKERAEARAERIKKVDEFFDKAKDQFKGGAAYSTIIPPQVITAALEGMKKAYHAGEKVAKLIEDAVDYISNELGNASWDKEKFRKEWEEKLKDKPDKKKLTDEELKAKILDRFRNKLKGLSDKQKEDVVRKSFQKIVESGGLDYADFRKIIADVTGRGEMTDAEAAKLKKLVEETNKVDDAATRARTERTAESLTAYREAEVKAGTAQRELNTLLYNRPNVTKRLTSMLQLNTLGVAALVNNPVYNVINQLGIRVPVGVIKTGIDKVIQLGSKALGKEIKPETDVFSLQVQKEFFNKLGLGGREALGQFLTGLNRMDYIQKEVHGQQIRPITSMKELWDFSKGERNLTKAQVFDKLLQALPQGWTAEIIARTLNLGDKPMRFSAEGAQASAFAKSLGVKDIDYKLFIEFPREEAYRVYKNKGLSDAEAAKKADYIRDTIIKEGERSTFQQDNFANDILNRLFGGKDSGVGGLVKATVISPYIKIPANAYWSYFNIVNPEVAMLQSMIYGAKAFAKRKGDYKFSFDKNNSTAAKDVNEAKYWLAHAAVGFATRAVITSLVGAGIFRSANTADDTKKEREGEQFYEAQGTVNVDKLWAYVNGKNPDDVKNGLVVQNRWFGHWGSVGNTIAKREEEMTDEQKANRDNYWSEVLANIDESALPALEQGIFGNTSSLLTALNRGGSTMQAWGVNTMNMFTNIIHPAAFAQVSKAQLPYYTKTKADTFGEELKNAMLTRSSWLRKASGQYPPSKISIWGDKIEKEGNVVQKLFGFSKANDDNFAQPIYEDYKKTDNTKFFPSAVKPEINNGRETIKLPVKEAYRLEELVGQQRKALLAPYANDMAKFEGDKKVYSQLSEEEKLKNLDIIYDEGFKRGKELFLKEYPQYIATKETRAEKKEDKKESRANRRFRKSLQSK